MTDGPRIGLLQCGTLHPDLVARHGDYPVLFERLLGLGAGSLAVYDVTAGAVPSPGDADAWLVSGSASSVYEELGWIAPTEELLRQALAREVPVVAVCFGHQLLAQAMGGRVERAAGGWNLGARDYHLTAPPAPEARQVRLVACHQDQVVQLPDGATLVATAEGCPVAAYTLGPRALAIQPHPEFPAQLTRELTALRRPLVGDQVAEDSLASLDSPLDRSLVAGWMSAWLGG